MAEALGAEVAPAAEPDVAAGAEPDVAAEPELEVGAGAGAELEQATTEASRAARARIGRTLRLIRGVSFGGVIIADPSRPARLFVRQWPPLCQPAVD